MAIGLVGAGLFWIVAAGIPLKESIITIGVVTTVCLWGFIVVEISQFRPADREDYALWLFGPSLAVGAMVLFLLRLVTSKAVFLIVFVTLPLFWILVSTSMALQRKSLKLDLRKSFGDSCFYLMLFIGLAGTTLISRWNWVVPIAVPPLIAVLLLTRFKIRALSVLSGVAVGVFILAWQVGQARPSSWWRVAEGIPHDETILEAISNGLVEWGPTISPLHHGLNGFGAAAYHHLLFLVIGLVNYFSTSDPYESLLIVGPIVVGLSMACTILVFARFLLWTTKSLTCIPLVSQLGIIVCLLSLLSGVDSPSNWFGVIAVLATICLLTMAAYTTPTWRALGLIGFSILVVGFSKGVLIYIPVLAAVSLMLFNVRSRWKVVSIVLAFAISTIGFFSFASVAVSPFEFEFWPNRNMGSNFSINLSTFLVFVTILINPILLGFICGAMLCFSKRSVIRELNFSLLAVMIVAVLSQIFVSSTGPRSYEIFYVPGPVAVSLLILLLAIEQGINTERTSWKFVTVFVGIALVQLSSRIKFESVTSASLVFVAVSLYCVVAWLTNHQKNPETPSRLSSVTPVVAHFAIVFATISIVARDFPGWHWYRPSFPERLEADWYGTPAFVEVADFIQSNTDSHDLFAYSLCKPTAGELCLSDFRPAALTRRQFLSLSPLFEQAHVDEQTWSDLHLSQTIGISTSAQVIQQLRNRGVEFILADRRRVSDDWLESAVTSESVEVFRNTEYVILGIRSDQSPTVTQ